MQGWTRGIDIFDKSLIFFPIHENSHWYLIVLNNTNKIFEILDPYKPMSGITLPKKYKKQMEETKMKKIAEVELKKQEKVNYILHNFKIAMFSCKVKSCTSITIDIIDYFSSFNYEFVK